MRFALGFLCGWISIGCAGAAVRPDHFDEAQGIARIWLGPLPEHVNAQPWPPPYCLLEMRSSAGNILLGATQHDQELIEVNPGAYALRVRRCRARCGDDAVFELAFEARAGHRYGILVNRISIMEAQQITAWVYDGDLENTVAEDTRAECSMEMQ